MISADGLSSMSRLSGNWPKSHPMASVDRPTLAVQLDVCDIGKVGRTYIGLDIQPGEQAGAAGIVQELRGMTQHRPLHAGRLHQDAGAGRGVQGRGRAVRRQTRQAEWGGVAQAHHGSYAGSRNRPRAAIRA